MKMEKSFLKYIPLLCLLFVSTLFANAQTKVPGLLNKKDLLLVGQAQFSVMFWDIYKSSLFTTSGNFDGFDQLVIFEITYQKDITKQALIDKTIEQWQKMKLLEADYSDYKGLLSDLWPDISSGDRLALKVDEKRSHFYLNDSYIGSIDDKTFSKIFLDIWLSPKTTQPVLRRKLLEGKS